MSNRFNGMVLVVLGGLWLVSFSVYQLVNFKNLNITYTDLNFS